MNIKTIVAAVCVSALALSCCPKQPCTETVEPVDYVSVLTGTASTFDFSTGNTYPAIAMPWGMNFWTPQTGANGNGWVYGYFDRKIRGFKQTHQPSPWMNDWGEFSIMPVTTGAIFDENERESWFSHKTEVAKPYYYKVYLADHDVVAEMAPTARAAAFRLTYPEMEKSYLVVDGYQDAENSTYKGGSYVKILPEENAIIGYTTMNHGGVPDGFKNWFIVVSDTPFEVCQTVSDGKVSEASESKSGHSLAMVGFKTAKGQKVNLKVASSFISIDQARQNLKELDGKTIDQVAEEGRAQWNQALGRFSVQDGNIDNIRTFYSCLYRSLLFPHDLSEIDPEGKRVHYSVYDGQVHDGYLFADTGFWDTFRCLFPLLNLVYPEQSAKVQEGLVNAYLESGFLPEWSSPGHRGCMIGQNSTSVVADAFVKGIRGYDADKLWEAVSSCAHKDLPGTDSGRPGWDYYDALGYVPMGLNFKESAARTLEYAYNDWCIYTFGKALGRSEEELAPYAKAALNYKNVYDPEYKLMVGKDKEGNFERPFSPLKWGGNFTEGNSLHYTWSVFHDPQGLINLMGGEENFISQMDTVFAMPPIFDESAYGFVIHEIREMQVMNMGNYAHGNQPVQHMLYLYDWARQPWKAQARIRETMDKFYTSNFDGYCGDEDNGQTSAWYVFSAMGFYPVCPGTDQYALGTPLFKNLKVALPEGKTLNISAPANSKENFYVNALKVDGKVWDKNYLTHEALTSGASLAFDMASEPNTSRGIADEDKPYSFSE